MFSSCMAPSLVQEVSTEIVYRSDDQSRYMPQNESTGRSYSSSTSSSTLYDHTAVTASTLMSCSEALHPSYSMSTTSHHTLSQDYRSHLPLRLGSPSHHFLNARRNENVTSLPSIVPSPHYQRLPAVTVSRSRYPRVAARGSSTSSPEREIYVLSGSASSPFSSSNMPPRSVLDGASDNVPTTRIYFRNTMAPTIYRLSPPHQRLVTRRVTPTPVSIFRNVLSYFGFFCSSMLPPTPSRRPSPVEPVVIPPDREGTLDPETVSRGVPAQLLEILPIEVFSANTMKRLDSEICLICHLDYVTSERRKRLPCLHHFHVECIDRWLVTRESCPVCRLSVIDTLRQTELSSWEDTVLDASLTWCGETSCDVAGSDGGSTQVVQTVVHYPELRSVSRETSYFEAFNPTCFAVPSNGLGVAKTGLTCYSEHGCVVSPTSFFSPSRGVSSGARDALEASCASSSSASSSDVAMDQLNTTSTTTVAASSIESLMINGVETSCVSRMEPLTTLSTETMEAPLTPCREENAMSSFVTQGTHGRDNREPYGDQQVYLLQLPPRLTLQVIGEPVGTVLTPKSAKDCSTQEKVSQDTYYVGSSYTYCIGTPAVESLRHVEDTPEEHHTTCRMPETSPLQNHRHHRVATKQGAT